MENRNFACGRSVVVLVVRRKFGLREVVRRLAPPNVLFQRRESRRKKTKSSPDGGPTDRVSDDETIFSKAASPAFILLAESVDARESNAFDRWSQCVRIVLFDPF